MVDNSYLVSDSFIDEELKKLLDTLYEDIKLHPYYKKFVEAEKILDSSVNLRMKKSHLDELSEQIEKYKSFMPKNEIKKLEDEYYQLRKEYFSDEIVVKYNETKKQLLSLVIRLETEILSVLK